MIAADARAVCREKRGTITGVNRHNRAKDPLCRACRQARADYMREYRERSAAGKRAVQRAAARRNWALKQLVERHRDDYESLLHYSRTVIR